MRTTSRLAASAAVLAGGLLLAAPASAQEVCSYPFNCPPPAPETPVVGNPGGGGTGNPGGGGGGNPGGGGTSNPGGGGTTVVRGGGGGAATGEVDSGPARATADGGDSGATLPFTGGEVTLLALSGAAAVGGGAVLIAAGRKRAKA